jgi:ectoine hydroxylase-related dioxygenase (phytanoyl-CoA dioxygenase family)
VGLEIRASDIPTLADGVRRSSEDELRSLVDVGYVVVPAVLDAAQLDRLRAEFERLVAADPQAQTHELGNRRTNATRDNDVFAVCWRHRVVLDAAAHLLGARFEVGHVDLRDPIPPHGVQKHHPDHGPEPCPGLTATWFLDAFTATNGSTRVLPGSHVGPVPDVAGSDERPLDGEIVTVGPAGSVLLRDARLYHAAGRNLSNGPRRGALVFYQHHIPGAD